MSLILIEQLEQYLVAQGIARADITPTGGLPPVWLNPIDGPKQPANGDTAAITLRPTGQLPTNWNEGFLENAAVEVIVRARQAPAGERLQRAIRAALNDRKHFQMGGLVVQWCLLARGVQPLPLPPGATTKTWDTTQTLLFQVRTADLAAA